MLLGSSKSNLTCEAGCGLRFCARIVLGSWSDHGRIGPALEMTFQLFSANFCQVLVSLFVAGAVLGEVLVSLFVAGAILGEVLVSLFVAGAALGEGLNVRLGAKRCIFP